MRSSYSALFLFLALAAAAAAQIVLDPSPARVIGHPTVSPAEQLVVTNVNPNLGVSGGMYAPQGIAVDTSGAAPILYVADYGNNRVLAWKNATSTTLKNLQAPDLIIGQPNSASTFALTNGGLASPTGLMVDSKGNLYIADSGNNRVLRYPAPFASGSKLTPDIVIGQPDPFTSRAPNQGGSPSAKTLYLSNGGTVYLSALAMDGSGNLFVADAGNNRVLRIPAASLTSGALDPVADEVIGQTSFTTVSSPNGQLDKNILYQPAGLAFDTEGHLFVTDGANRLIVFPSTVSSAEPTNDPTALRFAGIVIPSPSAPNGSTLYNPQGVVMINDGPAVVDTGDNRILVFDSFHNTDWAATDSTLATPAPVAITVLGQGSSLTNFSSVSANAGNAQGCASPCTPGSEVATMSGPVAAAVAGADLFVVDAGNNRVLVYPNAGQTAAASVVLGQRDFPYNSVNSIQGKEFYFATLSNAGDAGVAIDSSSSTPRLYVSDPGNHRVLGFADARKAGPGVAADIVIGQPDLYTGVCNFGGVTNPAVEAVPRQPTQSSLCYPTGVTVDPSGNLYVADSENGRVLRFPTPFAAGNSGMQSADLVLGQSGFTGISNPQASQSVMEYPYGLVFDPARGLLVSDVSANRVLLFSMTNPANGEPAATVIGQPNFVGTSSTVLSSPHHIGEDTIGQVYVADSGHNQITIFAIPTGTSTNQPVNTLYALANGGTLNDPQGVWVNQSTVANYHNDIWVADRNGISRFPIPNPLGTGNQAKITEAAAEITGGQSLACPGSGYCTYPALALTQDAYGNLYVADASNRVGIHYPALAAENGASFTCAMGCNLGGLNDPQSYLAPGAFASLFTFGGSFATSTTINDVLPVPTTLGGLQVLVNGTPSPITAVTPSQINLVLPFEAPTSGTAAVTVLNPSTQQVLGSGTMVMNTASPGFFTKNQNGSGQIAALNCNQTPCEDTVNGSSNPVNPGKYIQFYLTGQGQISNAPPDGQGATGAVPTSSVPAVYIGGSQATVQYSGLAPGYPGLWQINVQVPASLTNLAGFAAGTFPVQVYYQGLTSNLPANNANPSLATTIAVNAPE